MPSLKNRLFKYLSLHRVKVDAFLEAIEAIQQKQGAERGKKFSLSQFCHELGNAQLGLSQDHIQLIWKNVDKDADGWATREEFELAVEKGAEQLTSSQARSLARPTARMHACTRARTRSCSGVPWASY